MANFADGFRRFMAAWVTLIASLSIGPFLLAVVLALGLPAGWDGGRIYAHPLALSVVWGVAGASRSCSAHCAAYRPAGLPTKY